MSCKRLWPAPHCAFHLIQLTWWYDGWKPTPT